MNWVDHAVDDFGRGLGLPGLAFNNQGVASLEGADLGALFLERVDGGLLVYLARELDRAEGELLARALELCHWRHNRWASVNAALRGDRVLVFSVLLPAPSVDLPTLQRAVSLLEELHTLVHEPQHA